MKRFEGPEEFSADWDQLTAQARDEELLGGGYDKPLQQLLDACRGTELAPSTPSPAWRVYVLRAHAGRSKTSSRRIWSLIPAADTSCATADHIRAIQIPQ